MAGQDELVADGDAALGRQATQVLQLSCVELLTSPLGGSAVTQRYLVEPGEGGREVAVRDGDVRVARDDQGARRHPAP